MKIEVSKEIWFPRIVILFRSASGNSKKFDQKKGRKKKKKSEWQMPIKRDR